MTRPCHRPAARRGARAGGFTLFELVVALILLALFLGVEANRVAYLRASAEEAEVRWIVAALRTALHGQQDVLRIGGQPGHIAHLREVNPMAWLDPKPANYRGEYYRPEITDLKQSGWYFDRATHCLIYVPNWGHNFAGGKAKMLKFKVESSRKSTAAESGSVGVVLNEVES